MADMIPAAAGFKSNTFQEIKSHSSVLFNERLAILFYRLDTDAIDLFTFFDVHSLMRVRATLIRIYNNVRTLIYNNPTMRATLNLETKEPGVYVTDVAFDSIERMVQFCQKTEWTQKRIYIIAMELNKLDMLLKDVLQYFSYFLRPDFRQRPDLEIATERYKEIADKRTVEELRAIVGLRHKIDFDNILNSRLDFKDAIEAQTDEPTHIPGDLSIMDAEDKEDDYEEV